MLVACTQPQSQVPANFNATGTWNYQAVSEQEGAFGGTVNIVQGESGEIAGKFNIGRTAYNLKGNITTGKFEVSDGSDSTTYFTGQFSNGTYSGTWKTLRTDGSANGKGTIKMTRAN